MYLLNVKPKKVDTSDYQILKMTHPSSILECTTRAPSIGERETKFASQIKQLLWHTVEAELQPVHRAVHTMHCIVVFVNVIKYVPCNSKKANAGSKMNDAVCN